MSPLAARSTDRPNGWFAGLLLLLACSAVMPAWAEPISGVAGYATALLLTSAWFFSCVIRRRTVQWHWINTALVVCAMWGVIQTVTGLTVYKFATLADSAAWLAAAGIFCVSANCFSTEDRLDLLSRTAVWFGGILSILTVLCWYTASNTILWVIPTGYSAENAGPFLNRDHYAVFVELMLPFALARCLHSGRPSPVDAIFAATMYASVLVTASRAGTLLVTAEMVIFLLLALRQTKRGIVTAAVIGGCVLTITGAFGADYVIQRFGADDLFTFRREMLMSTLQMIQANWITGFGLGTWPTVYPGFAVFDPPGFFMNHAHNDWAEWTADGGIVLLAAITSVAAGAFRISRRNWWSLGVPVAFLHALLDFPFHKSALVICTFMILGAAVAWTGNRAESE